ncbi:MAG: hypothetical protein QOD86_2888 [Miltoncostaeaceae bacterium]|jgi:septal ring-binding cell division protein DamX|nr:hypothetical protein [Miltoncostaeaceae bacterium]
MIVVAVITLATAALVFAFIQLSDDNNDKVASNPPPRPAAAAQTGPTGTSGPTGPETSLTGPTGPDDADPSATPSPDGTTTPDSSATPDSSTTPDASSTSTPSATSTPPDSVTGRSELTEWPTGKTAYTVIIYSGETRAQSEAKARSLNLPGLGILRSRDYSSLRAGYWVLWSGQYENLQQATAASKGLQSNAPGAYPKQVKPK